MPLSAVAVVGLGYVGLPLAIEFGKKFPTVGYDHASGKIALYRQGVDPTREIDAGEFGLSSYLEVTDDPTLLSRADIIVVAVPTPVNAARMPDFGPLTAASTTVGRNMRRGATVVFESTVYPGATEEVCIPVLQQYSGLVWQRDFHVGYSPERINPGDHERTLTKIVKVVAGDTPETLDKIAALYEAVISAGVYRAPSIKVAEAAKVIENTQRDLNIALMNELSMICDRLEIDTTEVLAAAGTKWNFVPFRPGLVGGHCIGVDPYYLTHKAEMVGYHPQVILAGRRINDGMASYVAQKTVKLLIQQGEAVRGARIVVLGLTFKENCADLRNSKVADLVSELADFGCEVSVHDPIASTAEAEREYNLALQPWTELPVDADAIVAAVPHKNYVNTPLQELTRGLKPGGLFVDVRSAFDRGALRKLGYHVWRL